MKREQCPICYTELEVIYFAPCNDCGHLKSEIQHFNEGVHEYNVYNIYKGLKLQLCNFCDVDFGSYKSEYLGFTDERRLDLGDFEFVSHVKKPLIQKGKYCPECYKGLTFLVFLRNLREILKSEEIK